MSVLALSIALATASAVAQDVTLAGKCPGPARLHVTGFTPGASIYMVASDNPGSFLVPAGACAGTNTGLAAPVNVYGPFTDTDVDGILDFPLTFPAPACNKHIVAFDPTTCSPSIPPVSFSALGGAFTCGSFGDVLATHTFGPSSLIVDSDRIAVTPTEIHALVFNDVYTFDHALNLLRGPVAFSPQGNNGLEYNPMSGNVYGYQVASASADLTVWDGAVTGEISVYDTGRNTGAGFVDPATGEIHLVNRAGSGLTSYNESGTNLGDWAGGVSSPWDAELGPFNRVYLGSRAFGGNVHVFDFTTGAEILSFGTTLLEAVAVDDNGTTYVINRSTLEIEAWAPDGVLLGSISVPEEASAITFNPHTRELIVGYYNGGTGIVKRMCPASP